MDRSLRRAVGGDIYLRSVLSAHHKQTATPVCDNHSWKMKSAVRQANSINTYSGVEHSMDTDVKTLIQAATFFISLFFMSSLRDSTLLLLEKKYLIKVTDCK